MSLSPAEENYLKTIYLIGESENFARGASTNAIAAHTGFAAPSVTEMLKKLQAKHLVDYQPYRGAGLTPDGARRARLLLRRHRLWQVFLVERLHFDAEQASGLAEKLQRLEAPDLLERLETYLGSPAADPQGRPIPDREGNFPTIDEVVLSNCTVGQSGEIVGLRERTAELLRHLDVLGLSLGTRLTVEAVFSFDGTLQLRLTDNDRPVLVSQKVADSLLVRR